jgi:hypothetical protein
MTSKKSKKKIPLFEVSYFPYLTPKEKTKARRKRSRGRC